MAGIIYDIDNPTQHRMFGQTMAQHNEKVVIGTIGGAEETTQGPEKVWVYDMTTGNQLLEITNPDIDNTPTPDGFGQAVAIDGSYIAVSSWKDVSNGVQGCVHIFDANTGALIRTIDNPNVVSGDFDNFGNSYNENSPILGGHPIDLYNGKLAVGAWAEDGFGVYEENSGVVYIFDISTGNLDLTVSNPNAFGNLKNDNFGYAVKLNSYGLFASASREHESAAPGADRAGIVYRIDSSTGALLNTYYPQLGGDIFGSSFCFANDQIIISYKEAFQIEYFDIVTGVYIDKIAATNTQQNGPYDQFFGSSCSYDPVSDKLLIGIPGANYTYGAVEQYNWTTKSIEYRIENPIPEWNAYFGYLNAYYNGSIAVTAPGFLSGGQTWDYGIGRLYIMDPTASPNLAANNYTLSHIIYNPSLEHEQFGIDIATSSDKIAVGTYGGFQELQYTDPTEYVYVYDLQSGNLEYSIANPDINTVPAPDGFGRGIAMNDTYLALGAHLDQVSPGVSGVVHIYDTATGNFLRSIANPNGDPADDFGNSTSGDSYPQHTMAVNSSNLLAICSRGEWVNGNKGVVRIYDMTDGSLYRTVTTPGTGDTRFGEFINFEEDNVLAIGARLQGSTNSGAVWLYNVTNGWLSMEVLGQHYTGWGANTIYFQASDGNEWRAITEHDTHEISFLLAPGDVYYPGLTITGTDSYFGYNLAHSTDTRKLIVSNARKSVNLKSTAGEVLVYNDNDMSLIQTIQLPSPNTNDKFGYVLESQGRYLVVAAPGRSSSPNWASGAVYVYASNVISFTNTNNETLTGNFNSTVNNPVSYAVTYDPLNFVDSLDNSGNYSITPTFPFLGDYTFRFNATYADTSVIEYSVNLNCVRTPFIYSGLTHSFSASFVPNWVSVTGDLGLGSTIIESITNADGTFDPVDAYELVSDPQGWLDYLNDDGTFSYTIPYPNVGTYSFTYRIKNGFTNSYTEDLTVNITGNFDYDLSEYDRLLAQAGGSNYDLIFRFPFLRNSTDTGSALATRLASDARIDYQTGGVAPDRIGEQGDSNTTTLALQIIDWIDKYADYTNDYLPRSIYEAVEPTFWDSYPALKPAEINGSYAMSDPEFWSMGIAEIIDNTVHIYLEPAHESAYRWSWYGADPTYPTVNPRNGWFSRAVESWAATNTVTNYVNDGATSGTYAYKYPYFNKCNNSPSEMVGTEATYDPSATHKEGKLYDYYKLGFDTDVPAHLFYGDVYYNQFYDGGYVGAEQMVITGTLHDFEPERGQVPETYLNSDNLNTAFRHFLTAEPDTVYSPADNSVFWPLDSSGNPICPARVSIESEIRTIRHTSRSMKTNVVGNYAQRYMLDVEYPPMKSAEAQALIVSIETYEGGSIPFYLPIPWVAALGVNTMYKRAGNTDNTISVETSTHPTSGETSGNKGDDTVVIQNCPLTDIQAGLLLRFGNHDKLYKTVEPSTRSSGGHMKLKFEPPLRQSIEGSTIVLRESYDSFGGDYNLIRVRLTDDSIEYTEDASGLVTIRIKFTEDV